MCDLVPEVLEANRADAALFPHSAPPHWLLECHRNRCDCAQGVRDSVARKASALPAQNALHLTLVVRHARIGRSVELFSNGETVCEIALTREMATRGSEVGCPVRSEADIPLDLRQPGPHCPGESAFAGLTVGAGIPMLLSRCRHLAEEIGACPAAEGATAPETLRQTRPQDF